MFCGNAKSPFPLFINRLKQTRLLFWRWFDNAVKFTSNPVASLSGWIPLERTTIQEPI